MSLVALNLVDFFGGYHLYIYIFTCICIYTCICTHIYMYIPIRIYVYGDACACIRTFTSTRMCVYVYIYIYVYVLVDVYIEQRAWLPRESQICVAGARPASGSDRPPGLPRCQLRGIVSTAWRLGVLIVDDRNPVRLYIPQP